MTEKEPFTDAGYCCGCRAMKICTAVVGMKKGIWNPYGSELVKPCPGVL